MNVSSPNEYASMKDIKDKMYVYAYRIQNNSPPISQQTIAPIVQPFTQQYANIINTKNKDSFHVYKDDKQRYFP